MDDAQRIDPIELARRHAADEDDIDGDEFVDLLGSWSAAERRAYSAELARLRPALGPLPWPLAAAQLLLTAATGQIAIALRRRIGWPAWLLAAAVVAGWVRLMGDRIVEAERESARRRGVERAVDGPPRPALWPLLAVTVGRGLTMWWLRRRGRMPGEEDVVWVVTTGLVTDLQQRWRWRKYPVIRD